MTDPFSQHEALDRAHLLADAFQRHLANHPFIRDHPDLAARCAAISDALGALYQAIGAVEGAAGGDPDEESMATGRWDDGMAVTDFHIGLEFNCADRHWRCTDVGSRVITAIRMDQVARGDGKHLPRTEAEAEGWFIGPPYTVLETVFDEDDMKGCVPLATGAPEAVDAERAKLDPEPSRPEFIRRLSERVKGRPLRKGH